MRSVIFTSLDYQLFSVKRFSLCSKRKRSELLFAGECEVSSFFFKFHISYAPYGALLFMIIKFDIPALSQKGTTSGQVLLTRRNFQKRKSRLGFTDCPSSSEKSPVVAPVKITIAFARFFLLRLTTSSRQTPRLRFPAKGGKALMRRCRSSSAQRHGCTNCKKRSLCSVFCKTFAYHLCAVKRFSLCSKRKRSELLFAGSGRFRATFFMFSF